MSSRVPHVPLEVFAAQDPQLVGHGGSPDGQMGSVWAMEGSWEAVASLCVRVFSHGAEQLNYLIFYSELMATGLLKNESFIADFS